MALDDGRTLECEIYTATSGTGGGPQSVLERLNDGGEEFIPVALGEDRYLLNKSGIVSVEIDGSEDSGEVDADAGRHVPVRLSLTGGMSMLGRFHIVMPPQQSRVIDYLNQAPRFTALLGENKVTFVQRSYIVTVRSEE